MTAIDQDIYIAGFRCFSPCIGTKETHTLDTVSHRNRTGDLPDLINRIYHTSTSSSSVVYHSRTQKGKVWHHQGEKRYDDVLLARGIPAENIRKYGFAFQERNV